MIEQYSPLAAAGAAAPIAAALSPLAGVQARTTAPPREDRSPGRPGVGSSVCDGGGRRRSTVGGGSFDGAGATGPKRVAVVVVVFIALVVESGVAGDDVRTPKGAEIARTKQRVPSPDAVEPSGGGGGGGGRRSGPGGPRL